MRPNSIRIYLIAMFVAALSALHFTDWDPLLEMSGTSSLAFIALIAMAVVSEGLAVKMRVGQGVGNTSVAFIPLLAAAQLFGPAGAIGVIASGTVFGEFVIRRKPLERALFNVSQLIVAASLGGAVFLALAGVPLQPLLDSGLEVDFSGQFVPFIGFGFTFLIFNHAAVSLAIALSQGLRFTDVWHQMLGRSGATLHDFLISPIALGVAFLYVQLGITGILLAFLPLLFVRHAYLDTSRLREANAALLKALVKAIETRDPYTSGHSLRVSHLSKRIAEALGLPRSAVERIEQAALLHDIGKIEAVYTGILSKPADLSPEERAIIQSHVTKGEELLRNLSSFPDDVLLTVRHHHERYDGTGYPDGIGGKAIPLGARIVAVCDAVDAMLSDRPYRKALTVERVRSELQRCSEAQFSPDIVDVVTTTGLIEEYAEFMGLWRRSETHDDEGLASRFPELPRGPRMSQGRRRTPQLPSQRPESVTP